MGRPPLHQHLLASSSLDGKCQRCPVPLFQTLRFPLIPRVLHTHTHPLTRNITCVHSRRHLHPTHTARHLVQVLSPLPQPLCRRPRGEPSQCRPSAARSQAHRIQKVKHKMRKCSSENLPLKCSNHFDDPSVSASSVTRVVWDKEHPTAYCPLRGRSNGGAKTA